MRKNRGQALVEFVIIVPILLLIILGMVDFGNIIYQKYKLESSLDTVVELYKNDNQQSLAEFTLEQNLEIDYQNKDEFVTIILTKEIDVMTPGLNIVLNDPYKLSVERTIYDE